MNKCTRRKKEKIRLARLSAARLGKVFTEMDDDKTVLAFVEAHKNDIPSNKKNEDWKIVENGPLLAKDEQVIEKIEAKEKHTEESRMSEEILNKELAEFVGVDELSEDRVDTQRVTDLDLELIRYFEQARLLEEVLIARKNLKNVESEALLQKLCEEEDRIRIETGIKEDQRISEVEVEKLRIAAQNEYIIQSKLLSSQKEYEIESEALSKKLKEEEDRIKLETKIKEDQRHSEIEVEKIRSEAQSKYISQSISQRENEIESEALLQKLKEEEDRIKLEAGIKEDQRNSEIEVEKLRSEAQSEYITQAILLSQRESEVESELLSQKLKEEEDRIKLETGIKEAQRLSEIEVENIRVKAQSKYIVQALLSLSQIANEEDVVDENESALNDKLPEYESAENNIIDADDLSEKLKVEKEDVVEEVTKTVNQTPKRKIQITKSSINGKGILLVKREYAKAAGLDDLNNALNYPGSQQKAKSLEDNEKINEENVLGSSNDGISIVSENGIDYVAVNGIKIDTKNKVIKTLGIEDSLLKKVEHQTITKDDGEDISVLEDTESNIRKELKKKNGKKKRKIILMWIIILLLFAGGSYIYNFYNVNRRLPWAEEKLTGADATTYMNVKVEEQITNPKVKITGSLEADELQTVVLRTNGAIKSINVKEGDIVKKGDVLVTVDDTTEQYNIANLESQLKSAQLTGNANTVKLLELQLENAKNNLEYTKATANFDGVVAEQGWTVGDYNSLTVNNSNNMIIADLSKFKATVVIDELDIGYIEIGEKVELSFDSLPGVTVNAFVSSIPMLGYYSKQGFGVLNVEITIPDPPKQLKTGFTFSGDIIGANEESIIVVDQAAITSSGDISIVKIKMPDGSIKDIPVTIRYLGENKVQILSGDIYIGDTVVIENAKSFAEENGINLGL